MNRPEHENVDFFIGTEVEHSPAYGYKTLFVVGLQDATRIISMAKTHQIQHIYFGANQSFPNPDFNDAGQWKDWENMIKTCMDSGYLCTLDLDVSCAEGLVEGPLTEYNNFIPMISVKIPYIQLLGYNATLKLDDKDFRATNPGVWCHSIHDLKDRSKFTDWSKYTKDQPL